MKVIKSSTFLWAALALLACISPTEETPARVVETKDSLQTPQEYFDSVQNWIARCDKLGHAVSYVESRDNPLAYNPKFRCRGVLQITPIKMYQCNRYLRAKCGEDCDTFVVEDCFDEDLSFYMFELDMSANNPELDPDKAADLWNPNHSKRYADEIKKKYSELSE